MLTLAQSAHSEGLGMQRLNNHTEPYARELNGRIWLFTRGPFLFTGQSRPFGHSFSIGQFGPLSPLLSPLCSHSQTGLALLPPLGQSVVSCPLTRDSSKKS